MTRDLLILYLKKYPDLSRIILSLFILAGFISCSPSSEDKDFEPPAIDLYTPQDQQGFTGSQTILISGLVKDNRYIKEIHIEISNQLTGEQYQHIHIHPNTSESFFNHNFVVQTGKVYQIRVIADDAGSNSSVKKVQIACN